MSSNRSKSPPKRRFSTKVPRNSEGRLPTMVLPDRFNDLQDDADEDVLPPSRGPGMFMNMNQSIFGLIATAGSAIDFNDRFEGQSSDEYDENDDSDTGADDIKGKGKAKRSSEERVTKTTILKTTMFDQEGATGDNRDRQSMSGRLSRSLHQPARFATRSPRPRSNLGLQPLDSSDHAQHESPVSPTIASESPAVETDATDRGERSAPVLGRMLDARAEMSSRPSFELDGFPENQSSEGVQTGPGGLARRLKEIFKFDEPEEVIEEFPCWLLQSVLLQGYMYITSGHICFYAYLPKKAQKVTKSGFLAKSGKRNPKYSRFWFRLRGDVLAYYHDASNPYFPHGQIDLRYAISASVTDDEKDGVHFSVATHQRTYHFRAESAASCKEWVKSLQRVIFRSHNDGDSVKISLPIGNILDVEDRQLIELANTCKVRVIDNDETYSIDEYFFTFFSSGEKAIELLKMLAEDSSRQVLSDSIQNISQRTAVGATSSPRSSSKQQGSSPRPSGDMMREVPRPSKPRSLDRDLRSQSQQDRTRGRSPCQSQHFDSSASQDNPESDSFVQCPSDPNTLGLIASSNQNPSGSQILEGSEVFHRPIIRRSTSTTRTATATRPLEKGSSQERARETSQPLHTTKSSSQANETLAGQEPDRAATPTLQNLAKMGSYPLYRAGAFANYLNQTSRKMTNLLATESMGYVEKVSGMWKGGRKHYHETPGDGYDAVGDDASNGVDENHAMAMERFRAHFTLPETEKLRATYFGYLIRVLPLYGKVYISDRHFCFRSLLPGTRTKLILPLKDIETADKENGFRFGYLGLVVVIRGHEELFFEFGQADVRDDCAVTLLQSLETTRYLREAGLLDNDAPEDAEDALAERDALNEARLHGENEHGMESSQDMSSLADSSQTILFDDPRASFVNFKPSESLHVTCLTIGSRGDVQPYIALCKGLMADGHKVRIATHLEFREWIEGHGIEFRPVAGDPSELMNICIQNGTFTWAFLREANSKFRPWLDGLLASAYTACQGSDVLIESPSAMAGIHIAEALSIPYFRAFTMPWTRTRAYPHAFVMPANKMGGAYNYITYVMFDNIFWKTTAHQVNRWRNKVLGIPNTNLEKMQPNKVPFLYNFSPAVVAPPLDYSDWIRVTGYWFLDEGQDWTPPDDLKAFIDRARKDNKKLVYVGFGSIIVSDPAKMTQEVIDGVLKADVRCILSKGWSDRMDPTKTAAPEQDLPPEIFQIKSAPHDWLFRQIDAAAHHGGSGTTGASLRAGIPTVIRPFFGDQFFFGSRVEDLGVGICLKKWGANSFAKALWEATHSDRMITKARLLGETIRQENGVNTAIQTIYRDLEYAKSLVLAKAGKNAATVCSPDDVADGDESEQESWTFVGGDDEAELELALKKGLLTEAQANFHASTPSIGYGPLGGPAGKATTTGSS